MTVSIVDGQLKVTLTETETVKFNIDRVFFEKSSDIAQKALSDLLRLAASKVSFGNSATQFLIELYPVFEGGCEVWFKPQPTVKDEKRSKATVKKITVFEFDTSEAMFLGVEALYRNPKTRYCASALLKCSDKYRLVVANITPSALRDMVCNFADRVLVSPIQKVKTFENGQTICPKNAVAIIGAALLHDRIE